MKLDKGLNLTEKKEDEGVVFESTNNNVLYQCFSLSCSPITPNMLTGFTHDGPSIFPEMTPNPEPSPIDLFTLDDIDINELRPGNSKALNDVLSIIKMMTYGIKR